MMKKIILFFMLCYGLQVCAQPGSSDSVFNATDIGFAKGDGPNGAVRTTLLHLNGKIIICGDFTAYNGVSSKYIARLNENGSLDSTFNIGTGADDVILNASLQSDGKIIIGGQFTSYNSTKVNRIARLNTDGSLDNDFNTGTGADGTVLGTAVQSDGKIIILGDFISYNGIPRNHIARLNSDGTLDLSFNPGMSAESTVYTVALQSDNKIVIGGGNMSFNGIAQNGLCCLNSDGSLDAKFSSGLSTADSVMSILIQPNAQIVIGGYFSFYGTIAKKNIARLNTNGSLDLSFDSGIGADSTIFTMTLQSDNKIIVGGCFVNYNEVARKYLVRLNTDGGLDSSFNPDTLASNVWSISVQPDGKIVVAKSIGCYASDTMVAVSRFNSDGSSDFSFNSNTGANNNIYSASVQSDGKMLIGGMFNQYNGVIRNHLARLDTDGNLDGSFNPGLGPNNCVKNLLVQSDGKIIIVGSFTSYNNMFRKGIARLNTDGSLDTNFYSGIGVDYYIETAILQPDGKIIIVGAFTNYGGISRNGIARLNTDGSLDTSFDPGVGANDNIKTIAIQPDGKIVIGGDFTAFNNIIVNGMVRLNPDGSLDAGFYNGLGANNSVLNVLVQTDQKILICGNFSNYGNLPRKNIARLNSDGTIDVGFDPGICTDGQILNCLLQSDGKIIVTGNFTTFNGLLANRIVRLNSDGSQDVDFNSGIGANDVILNAKLISDDKLIICGGFTAYDAVGRNRIAKINLITPSPIALPQTFCEGAKVSALIATGSDLKWYLFPTGGEVLSEEMLLITGGYFVSQTLNGFESKRTAVVVTVNQLPDSPVITKNGEVFHSSSIYGNQWYNQGVIVVGAVFQDFTPLKGGAYYVVTNVNGCESNPSNVLSYTPSNGHYGLGVNEEEFEKAISVYPNPATDILSFGISKGIDLNVKIYDSMGKCVDTKTVSDKRMDVSQLSSGIYFVYADEGNGRIYKTQFVKK